MGRMLVLIGDALSGMSPLPFSIHHLPRYRLHCESSIEPPVLGPEAADAGKSPGFLEMESEYILGNHVVQDVELRNALPFWDDREPPLHAGPGPFLPIGIDEVGLVSDLVLLQWEDEVVFHEDAGAEDLAVGLRPLELHAELACGRLDGLDEGHPRDEDIALRIVVHPLGPS